MSAEQIAAYGAILTPLVLLVIAIGGGVKWLFTLAINTYKESAAEDAETIADLRKVREDTLATAIGENRAEITGAREDIAEIRTLLERQQEHAS